MEEFEELELNPDKELTSVKDRRTQKQYWVKNVLYNTFRRLEIPWKELEFSFYDEVVILSWGGEFSDL